MKSKALRGLLGEALGTALLLAVVVGSGHMGETLANGNTAIALLANSTATGLALWWLIVLFAPISGAHFNPLVTLVEAGPNLTLETMPTASTRTATVISASRNSRRVPATSVSNSAY